MRTREKIHNPFKCPMRIYKKFSHKQRIMYNIMRMYTKDEMSPIHKMTDEHFDTISHNLACMAAWAIED